MMTTEEWNDKPRGVTHLDQLTALRDAVRDGVWPGMSNVPEDFRTDLSWKAFNGSVDAALALFAALLPGWDYRINGDRTGVLGGVRDLETHSEWVLWFAPDPARALLLAMLEALIKKEEG